jgi:hypothetical protein
MNTWQSMKFQDEGASIDFIEAKNTGFVRVFVSRGESNKVDLDRKHLLELRKWINIQLSKMQPPKPNANTKPK